MKLDEYELRARLAPMVVLLLPALLLLLPWLSTDAGAVVGQTALFMAFAVFLAQLGRDRGKRAEKALFAKWGGPPTTLLLRRTTAPSTRSERLNAEAIEHVRASLTTLLPHVPLPSETQERANQDAADSRYTAIVTELRGLTYDRTRFPVLFAENCSYGFRRNLWAMRDVGVIVSLGATIMFVWGLVVGPPFVPEAVGWACSVVAASFATWWGLRVNDAWVKEAAWEYAHQLLVSVHVLARPPR